MGRHRPTIEVTSAAEYPPCCEVRRGAVCPSTVYRRPLNKSAAKDPKWGRAIFERGAVGIFLGPKACGG